MIKAYQLKIYPNKGKREKLNALFSFWQDQINHQIKIFWEFDSPKGIYPPKEFRKGGRLVSDASLKAWQIIKGAKKIKQKNRPEFKKAEIDLNSFSAKLIPDLKTVEFDFWISIISLDKRHRLKLPCKRTQIFNEAFKKGPLQKSFKLQKINNDYYLIVFLKIPNAERKQNQKILGVDVGLSNTIATSDGNFYGKELKDLRIRTKWRSYIRLSPIKQGLNHYAKELVEAYPDYDFAVENLLFKGKKNRSREFRRRNNNWAYGYLRRQLEQYALLKGFEVIAVNPKYTSQQCPVCGFIAEENRQGEAFYCIDCGFRGHADTVGAINIAERCIEEHPSLQARVYNFLGEMQREHKKL